RERSTSAVSPSSGLPIWIALSSGGASSRGRRPSRSKSARSRTRARIEMPDLRVAEIERLFREEHGRRGAGLSRAFGGVDIAEEAVQDAFAAAVQRWPSAGLPPSPAGWIITTARNRAIDRLRREGSRDSRHAQAADLHTPDEPDEETAVPDD